jgi:hypothetical protein
MVKVWLPPSVIKSPVPVPVTTTSALFAEKVIAAGF